MSAMNVGGTEGKSAAVLKIGEFSRLSGVSVRMLRHYDELGLLRPAFVDDFSGYRYYHADQLGRLHQLLVFKEMGFSLAQVACLLDGRLGADERRAQLVQRQAELEAQARQTQARLAWVRVHLNRADPGDFLATPDNGPGEDQAVRIKRVPALRVASARGVVPTYWHSGPLFERVRHFLAQHGVAPAGPSVTLYHDPEARERDVEVEVAYPVADHVPLACIEGVTISYLPALPHAAVVVHHGPMSHVGWAYRTLGLWISANGWRITGVSRSIALARGDDPATHQTEVLWPVQHSNMSQSAS
jgi:DNA-binding transcriptional MerR regulator/effector-binding domain-containing protein